MLVEDGKVGPGEHIVRLVSGELQRGSDAFVNQAGGIQGKDEAVAGIEAGGLEGEGGAERVNGSGGPAIGQMVNSGIIEVVSGARGFLWHREYSVLYSS